MYVHTVLDGKLKFWESHWNIATVFKETQRRTPLYWQQTSNDKNLKILLQLNAYKGFNWTHFRISLHLFDNVRTSLWETDHTIGWILFEVTYMYSCMRLREWKCCFRIDSTEIQRNLVQAKVALYTVNYNSTAKKRRNSLCRAQYISMYQTI